MADIIISLAVASVCATGFGIVFGIRMKELPFAALAGFITRIVIILTEGSGMGRFAYVFLTALVGTVYAEIVGRIKKTSIVKYMYPAMILLIPGDVLYKVIVNLLKADSTAASTSVSMLLQSLFGIAVGTMLGAMLFNIRRKQREE